MTRNYAPETDPNGIHLNERFFKAGLEVITFKHFYGFTPDYLSDMNRLNDSVYTSLRSHNAPLVHDYFS